MWLLVINFLISVVLSELLRPKPNYSKPSAASFNDVTVPTADPSRPIPVVWGTGRIYPANTWYGDFSTREVKHSVDTSWFTSMDVTDGYMYSMGMELALCHGAIDSLQAVVANDTHNVLATPVAVAAPYTTFTLYGSWNTAQGQAVADGVAAACELHCCDRTPSRYMQQVLGAEHASSHPQVTYVVWQGPSGTLVSPSPDKTMIGVGSMRALSTSKSGFFGASPSVPNLAFVVTRSPDLSALSEVASFASSLPELRAVNTVDGGANPATVIIELLTNGIWGLGLPAAYLDLDNFLEKAQVLAGENNSFNYVWETSRPAAEVLQILLRQINGSLERNLATGQYCLRLVRAGDPVVLTLDESNIAALTSITRAGVDERTNEIHASFFDRDNAYKTTPVIVSDDGAIAQSNARVPTSITYEGVTNVALASTLALRDLRMLSSPLAKVALRAVLPYGTLLVPGDVVLFNWPREGVSGMRLRVGTARYSATSGTVDLELLQDVFTAGRSVYTSLVTTPVDNSPGTTAPPILAQALTLAPYGLTGSEADVALYYAVQPGPYTSAPYYQTCWCDGPSFVLDDVYLTQKRTAKFALQGTLDAALTSTAQPSALTLAAPQEMLDAVADTRPTNAFVLVGAEWMRAASVTVQGSGLLLSGVQRAIFDTYPGSYDALTPVAILADFMLDSRRVSTTVHAQGNYGNVLESYPGHDAVTASAIAYSPSTGWSNVYSAASTLNAGTPRAALPYNAGNVQVNGWPGAPEDTEAYPNCGGNALSVTWSPRNRLNRNLSSWFTGDGQAEPGTTLLLALEQQVSGVWQPVLSTEVPYGENGNSLFVDPSQYGLARPAVLRLTLTTKRAFSAGGYVLSTPQSWCWNWN